MSSLSDFVSEAFATVIANIGHDSRVDSPTHKKNTFQMPKQVSEVKTHRMTKRSKYVKKNDLKRKLKTLVK